MENLVEIERWSPAALEASAGLLQARHARHRAAFPALPSLGHDGAVAQLTALEPETGYVARRAGEVVGYLVYRSIETGPFAGHAWVEIAGQAASDPEVTRTLYAHAARHWLDSGLRQHVVHAPATSADTWPWIVSSFGIQHTWLLRDTAPLARPDNAVTVRRIGPDEAEIAGQAEIDLDLHLQGSPVFSPLEPATLEEATRSQREFIADPGVCTLVAELDGRPVGYCEVTANPRTDLRAPAGAATIGIVVVRDGHRGLGIGRTLTAHLLDWAREQGHQQIVCDFRATNLESSRAFGSFGWQPTFYRLHRAIP